METLLGEKLGCQEERKRPQTMFDTGTTAFMLVCTMLVLLMTPGLAFFYGGLSRRKNVVNTMMMVMGAIGVVGVILAITVMFPAIRRAKPVA